jgi:hypothetical protein
MQLNESKSSDFTTYSDIQSSELQPVIVKKASDKKRKMISQKDTLPNEMPKDPSIRTDNWRLQDKSDSCFPTCIYNVLGDLRKYVDNKDPLNFTYTDLCNMVGYTIMYGTSLDDAIDGLELGLHRKKPKNQMWYFKHEHGKDLDMKRIDKVLSSPDCSLPVISLSSDYLEDFQGVQYKNVPQGRMDHSVVVVQHDGNKYTIHDCFCVQSPHGGTALRKIETKRLRDYWISASMPNSMLWFERQSSTLTKWL